jgi:hypothetical protein
MCGGFQIVVALLNRKERPEIPAVAAKLPGGTFDGMERYIQLIQRAWAENADERPTFEAIIADLRSLLEDCKAARAATLQNRGLLRWFALSTFS